MGGGPSTLDLPLRRGSLCSKRSKIRALKQWPADLAQQLLIEVILAAEPHNRMNGAPLGFAGGLAAHLPTAGPPLLQEFRPTEQPSQGGVGLIAALPEASEHLLGVAAAVGLKRELVQTLP